MFTYTKKYFQLSLITTFTTLFILGAAGVNTALATHNELQGELVIKETCDAGAGNKPIKREIKSPFQMAFFSSEDNPTTPEGSKDLMPFPVWTDSNFLIEDFDGIGGSLFLDGEEGIALSMNGKKGTFHTIVDDIEGSTQGPFVLSLTGKVLRDKNNPEDPGKAAKISGKIVGHDASTLCTYTGKFKAKQCPDNDCPDLP